MRGLFVNDPTCRGGEALQALCDEHDVEDTVRTRDLYRESQKLIPPNKFSFAKILILAAQFEIRRKYLKAAWFILGNPIGFAPKHKIFRKYIKIELQLGNIDCSKTLY